MKTLYDVENKKAIVTKKQKKLERIKKILGRDTQLPARLCNDEIINCGLSEPKEVLKKAGYRNIKRGWTKQISRRSRYHAYIYEDEFKYKWIYLHKDITRNGMHKASKDVLDEKIRLKEFIIPRINVGKKNDKILPREARLKALAELKNNRPFRRPLRRIFLERFLGFIR